MEGVETVLNEEENYPDTNYMENKKQNSDKQDKRQREYDIHNDNWKAPMVQLNLNLKFGRM